MSNFKAKLPKTNLSVKPGVVTQAIRPIAVPHPHSAPTPLAL
jgi:hypothetical protein